MSNDYKALNGKLPPNVLVGITLKFELYQQQELIQHCSHQGWLQFNCTKHSENLQDTFLMWFDCLKFLSYCECMVAK